MVGVEFVAVLGFGDVFVMHREDDLVAGRLDGRHVPGEHVPACGLGHVLGQLAAVGFEARPLAAVLIDAHVGQLAGVVELRAGVAEEAAGRQADAQPGAVAAQLQHAAFVGHAGAHHGQAGGFFEVFPE